VNCDIQCDIRRGRLPAHIDGQPAHALALTCMCAEARDGSPPGDALPDCNIQKESTSRRGLRLRGGGRRRCDQDDDDLMGGGGRAEGGFVDYSPQGGAYEDVPAHPAPVVEAAALASTQHPHLDGTEVHPELLARHALSAPQAQCVALASHCHALTGAGGATRGILIGDGTGVGKGREVAGIMRNVSLRDPHIGTHVWVSTSQDLRNDAARDMCAVGWGADALIDVGASRADEGAAGAARQRGVLFTTYGLLRGTGDLTGAESLRLAQLVSWLGGHEFEGVIALDEVHKASGCASATNAAVLALQAALPRAKMIYASATGAATPRALECMPRLAWACHLC
jgi:hypothetical protein